MNSYQSKFFVGARIMGGGTVLSSFGANTLVTSNINRSTTGTHIITMPLAHPSGSNYGIIFSSRGATSSGNAQMFRYSNPNSTSITIFTYNYSTGLVEDPVDFTFHTIP
jgi:hypothetical protein